MSPGHYVKLAMRESRRSRSRIGLFMACIAVGVAAIVLVAGLSTSVNDGVREEGRRLMAADVTIEGRRPLPPELDEILADFARGQGDALTTPIPVRRADVREFVSVVVAPDGEASQLAELKVVEGDYPFYGQLVLDPARPLGELLSAENVVVGPELLTRLDVAVGDTLRVGGVDFRIAGTVLEEPDKLSISFTLGPRVFLAPAGLDRTQLLDRGARVEYRAMLRLPDGATADDATRLEEHLEAALPEAEFYRVRTFTEAQPALRRTFRRMGRYLGLVGLLSLLVGGVGVAQVARAWIASRMDDIAILRCLGSTPREVVNLFVLQVLAMALVASAAGALLGTALHWGLPRMVGGLVPVELIRPWQPAAVLQGILMGLFIALIFTLPLLIGLRRVPPVRVLRRDAEPVRAAWLPQILASVLVLAGVWAAATVQADDFEHGSIFTGGLVATVLLLALVAWGVSRVARLLPRDAGGVRLRHGLAHLARPGAATIGAIVALGLGVSFVFATRLVERHLSEQLQAELPTDAPSTFLLDVQSDQLGALQVLLAEQGATGFDSQPIITARFAAIDGVPIEQVDRRRATRELRVTYGDELPHGNRVIAGAFPAGPAIPNGVSLEEDFAQDLGVDVGSTLTLDVQGVPVELVVTSVRTIEWRTFGINFFMFAEPGPLDDAPQQHVAVARIPEGEQSRVQARIVQAFPNVTVIHIRDVLEKVVAVVENVALAVRALGLFTVVAGIIVLGGTVAATQARRAREVALLKTIGMTRRDVAAVFAIEYALTGAVAAAVGITAGGLLAWAVLTQLMEMPWSPRISEVVIAIGLTIALAIIAGLFASARALAARPVEVLRSE